MLSDILKEYQFDINQTGDIRILDNCDSSSKQKSYYKHAIKSNQNQMCRTMNGFRDPKNIIHLQVKGKN